MAEGELATGIDGDDESTSPWSALPEEVQRMVLSHLRSKSLFQMRCVCKEWRDVLHRRDFRTMYDTVNESQERSPAICYVEMAYPTRLMLSSYDFAAERWERMSGFTSCPRLEFDRRHHHSWPRTFYSVGGLLCLYFWETSDYVWGESSWVVWQPLCNIWKKLPSPSCNQRKRNRGACFVHAWVSDEGAKTYKLLMAHDPRRWEDITRGTLVTEIYDSATGAWTHGSEFSFRSSEPSSSARYIRRGVLCNGIIYFCSGRHNSVLLSYDIIRDQWHEEVWNRNCVLVFEWDARLMSVTSSATDDPRSAFHEEGRLYVVEERNPNSGMWTETGIEIPFKVRGMFHISTAINVVARGNDLALTGGENGSFEIAVYKRAENYWRLPPTGAFSDKWSTDQVKGLVLHKPQLGWVP